MLTDEPKSLTGVEEDVQNILTALAPLRLTARSVIGAAIVGQPSVMRMLIKDLSDQATHLAECCEALLNTTDHLELEPAEDVPSC
jgi:hypothetical protein